MNARLMDCTLRRGAVVDSKVPFMIDPVCFGLEDGDVAPLRRPSRLNPSLPAFIEGPDSHSKESPVRRLMTVVAAFAALAFAQTAVAELKIAVVDVNEAVGQTQEARAFLERVQGELKPDQDRIRTLTADKSRIEERVERDGEVMSSAERVKLSEEYERVTSDLQYQAESYQKSLNRRRNELFREMGPRVQSALNEIIESEGYDMVVPAGAVIFAKPDHDITSRLAERLDQQSGR